MMHQCRLTIVALGMACLSFGFAYGEDKTLDTFRAQQLSDVYYSEGAAAGDLNNDGKVDFVYGPHWYEGPGFEVKHEIYPAKPQNREGYTDHFFAWVYDFDGDGWKDVFTVGFPGTPAFVYQNPGQARTAELWKKHQVFDWVSNESPQLIQLVGDDRPELVCTRDGFFGYATIDWSKPYEPWKFTAISAQITDKKFGHGLGIGDVNGDGKLDVIHSKGWLQQPNELSASKPWQAHTQSFSNAYGGAEMFAYDVDGDGDNDIITSIAAHDFGLAWFEQIQEGDERKFTRHDILGSKAQDNPYGLVFSELHSVNLADVDGDGLKDIITGKTYYSHHKGSPMWDTGAVVYWFKLNRGPNGVDWVPFKAADEAGVGRQIGLFDLNQDGLLDITVGGMKGAHALFHQRSKVSESAWLAAQPVRQIAKPTSKDQALIFEGEKLKVLAVTDGSASEQGMSGFAADSWSNDSQLWWTGGKVGAKLELELPVEVAGQFDVLMALTKAKDYGIIQISLDGVKLGEPIDLFNTPNVVSTGVVRIGQSDFKPGKHKLTFEIIGKNPAAAPGHMVGLDAVQLGVSQGDTPKSKAGKELNLGFEKGTLEDWTATGDAFVGQPIRGDAVSARRKDMKSGHQGEFWIGTFEKSGDKATGTLTSAPFVVDKPYASYLVGGGNDNTVRVELIDQDGKVFHRSSGRVTENMHQVVVDLKSHQGKELSIRLVDEGKGGWGHLNFDGFQLHASLPGLVSKSETPLVLDEYPFEGLNAEQAAKAMKLPGGFKVIVGASEPDVKQPIAMALDDRGRVWIAEAYEYPRRAEEGKGRDRILIFEDTDGNGTLDKRKVFAEGLNLISGMEVGFGGVWVGAAPYLLFIPDLNGDDVADGQPQILLDGWGYQDTHETLNTFIWGPDGWLYGCHGVFTHSRVGKPGTADKDRQPVNAGIWRYHPTRHTFEVFAHGTSNPWGVDFNDRGQAFLTSCVIPHLYHIIQGARYERQGGIHFNPYTYDDIKTIADHRHYIGATPHSGNGRSDEAGGGHAHAGAMIYLGGAWPDNYRDRIFMNNIHGQRLNVDILKQHGSGYVGSHSPDFLLTGDKASQILNLRYGPDGQAWMIDWYDMQACHLTDPAKHDRTNGRIYKIAYGDLKKSVTVSLGTASDLELVKHTLNPNDWFVRHGRRVLQERSAAGKVSDEAIGLLKKMAKEQGDETRRLRAAWALAAMEKLDAATCEGMLADKSEYVRGWGVQLGLESKLAASAVSPSKLAKMAANEKSQVTRLYLASAAQRIPPNQRWELVQNLLANAADANDHNLPLMVWYAAEPLAEQDPERALALGLSATSTIPLVRNNMLRRIGATGNEQSLATLVTGLGKAKNEEVQIAFLDAIRISLAGRRKVDPPKEWDAVVVKLAKGSASVQQLSQALGVTFGNESALAAVRTIVESASESTEARTAGITTLVGARDPKLAPVLQSLLKDKGLRSAAIAGLAQYADSKTSDAILSLYSELSQNEKRAALTTLSSRSEYAIAMLEAIDAKRIAASDLTADLVRQLEYLKNNRVKSLLEKNWGTVRESPAEKTKLIEEYKALVESTKQPKPDLSLGRAVFAKTCQQCHVLFATGGNIGPELTGSNRANLDYLLSNIVDPSSVMAKEYQPTILNCDGRIVTGIVKAEDSKSVTLQKVDAIEVVPLVEIEERKLSDKSMMPEDQLKLFSKHEIRSLIAYLGSDRQNPVLATVTNAQEFFNGKNLTNWRGNEKLWSVDGNEIVGKTTGLSKNEFLVSEYSVGDFHLKLEVKLVANAGNSGIQFRSEQTEKGMLGYQADVGPGWWGKLYEEEGRALLWDKSGESHVKSGEWNHYEVRAQGSKIQTWINGQLCVDLDDPKGAKRGIMALQLHSGGPTEVRFRNVEMKVLE